MSWLDAINPLGAIVGKVLDKLFPDPAERIKAELELRTLDLTAELAQMEVNKAEAQSGSWFVAGWRPFIGWVCGAAFAYKFIVQPFLVFAVVAFGVPLKTHLLPALDWTEISAVLLGMLGLGTLRTYEKVKA